ncbi:hypothetical protein [Paraburkholderia silvatlantica]|uniref:hypothetical protein n=1 Tax=Paraburkholderia silvatlantica TaxID=321895 RepID=UPI0037505112
MLIDTPDLKAQREEHELALRRTFLRAVETADEMMALLQTCERAGSVVIDFDLLQRCAIMMSFCGGFALGAQRGERRTS